jgi:hypothetical protein
VSFTETARQFALAQADIFEKEARRIGIMRSVAATEAASWLDDIAKNLRQACEPDAADDAPAPPPAQHSHLGDLPAACSAALRWLENMAPTVKREALSRQLRRALGMPTGWNESKETTKS